MRFLGLCLRYVFLLLLCALTVSFVLSNDAQVTLSLFPLPYEMALPAFALAVISLILGLAIGLTLASLHGMGKMRRLHRESRDHHEKLRAFQQEVTALRLEREARAHYPHAREVQTSGFLPVDAVTR